MGEFRFGFLAVLILSFFIARLTLGAYLYAPDSSIAHYQLDVKGTPVGPSLCTVCKLYTRAVH